MNDDGAITGGPGIPAFIAFFFLVIALWLLMRNMNGRLRRMGYQHKIDDDSQATSGDASPPRRKRRPADGMISDSGATGPDRDKPGDPSDAPSPDHGGSSDGSGSSDGGGGSGGDA